MNNEQLEDWIASLNELWKTPEKKFENWRKIMMDVAPNMQILINYMSVNFEDVRLSQPIIAQLLALYYKLGVARCFVLQLVPGLINSYLISLSKKWRNCADVFEMFFLAIYNEEILAGGTGSPSMVKKVEEIRIPSVHYPSIYHDPAKLNTLPPEILQLKFNSNKACVQNTVRVGPYPAVDRIIAENRYLILTRLIRAVNSLMNQMAVDVVCRSMCLSLLNICRSGFSFNESDFRQRILKESASEEIFGDFARKTRISVSPHFLIECLNGINFSLFNGQADIALRALDAIHQRAQYEMFPDVLLETNALRNSLLDPHTLKMLIDSEKIGC
ncbi:hyccin domain-containing protein [Ditylenchus destructor]|uniref:Hyccin domain-containing protein n=1 Tax=Ditylenchus destructor TaxID=166010 RepID=A0AAD4NFM4_9BILA|nr:hyccin domain-containing protein [Ditylenchus destructor]